jgi:2-dehydropantoate 2-reductase
MRICVVGAGAIGGWIAGRLALAGHRVMALTSRGPVSGLELVDEGSSATAQLTSFDAPAELLVVAVKASALASALATMSALLGPETLVVPMLNGVPWWFVDGEPLRSVDPGGATAAAFPSERLIGSAVHASCSRTAPNRVIVKHADKLLLGELGGGTSKRIEQLCATFEKAGIRCEQSDAIRRAIWYKLWGNATVNPLSALTRATADVLLADSDLRQFMGEAMAELAQVGAAIGCPIAESSEDRMAVTARLGSFKPSMLQDVEAGRQIELEALVGAPREIARRHDIATPALDRIYALTRCLAASLSPA